MLSRVAERMYWLGRYMERAENTTLLISVNTNLAMDMPQVKHIWQSDQITGVEQAFQQRFSKVDERNVIKFLLDDEFASVSASIRMAQRMLAPHEKFCPTRPGSSSMN